MAKKPEQEAADEGRGLSKTLPKEELQAQVEEAAGERKAKKELANCRAPELYTQIFVAVVADGQNRTPAQTIAETDALYEALVKRLGRA